MGIWHPASGPSPQYHSPVLAVSVYLDLSFAPLRRRELIYAAGLVMALNPHCSGVTPHKNKKRSMACFALIYDFMAWSRRLLLLMTVHSEDVDVDSFLCLH